MNDTVITPEKAKKLKNDLIEQINDYGLWIKVCEIIDKYI